MLSEYCSLETFLVCLHCLAFAWQMPEIRERQESCTSCSRAKPYGWRIEIHSRERESETELLVLKAASHSLSQKPQGLARC